MRFLDSSVVDFGGVTAHAWRANSVARRHAFKALGSTTPCLPPSTSTHASLHKALFMPSDVHDSTFSAACDFSDSASPAASDFFDACSCLYFRCGVNTRRTGF